MKKTKLLITTAIDYTNDVIHIGHAYQKVLSDCLARYYRHTFGPEKVYFLTGTDEHGSTNEKAAKARNILPLDHVTEISAKDKEQLDALNLSYNRFIRTTNEDHKKIAQDFMQKSFDNGDIYLGKYEGLYCEGCESYKTLSELNDDGQCLLHPTRQIQKIEEENYFFRWSKYVDFLKDLLSEHGFVYPEGKRKEMLALVTQGLEDLPVSRPKYKVSWGIDVPFDHEHVIYVWFDALINYYTAGVQNGFWDDETEIIHVLGKDNAKWHAVLWPAMLKSAGYRLPDTVYVHGFINLDGEKISKSRGNVIRPTELTEKFGVDPVRYYFLKQGPIVEDVNISLDQFREVYNADLANGLGNTVARLAKLAEKSGETLNICMPAQEVWTETWSDSFKEFRVDLVLQGVWAKLSEIDKHINDNEPWSIKDKAKLKEVLEFEITKLMEVAVILEPFMPATSEKIVSQFETGKVIAETPLFPRIS